MLFCGWFCEDAASRSPEAAELFLILETERQRRALPSPGRIGAALAVSLTARACIAGRFVEIFLSEDRDPT